MTAKFNKKNTVQWMRLNAEEYFDSVGEIDMTSLAEGAAMHFNQDQIDGPLDDESHWIWDAALEIHNDLEGE